MKNQTKNQSFRQSTQTWFLHQWQRLRNLRLSSVHAEVGEGARNVAIGNFIIQIGKLSLPLSLFIGLVIGIALYVWLWPRLYPIKMDKGHYNIAVASFRVLDERGNLLTNDIGYKEAKTISNYLKAEQDELKKILNIVVNTWGPDDVQRVAGEFQPGSEKIYIDTLGANVLLYGEVRRRENGEWNLAPKFFLSFPDNKTIEVAGELRGEYALGTPVTFVPDDISYISDANQITQVRLKALLEILKGLSYYLRQTEEGYQKAVEIFQNAADNPEWGANLKEKSGQEILYHFLGGAYLELAVTLGDAASERQDLLTRSRQAYEKALTFNENYARSYNGLGVVQFQMARPLDFTQNCNWDWGLVKQAEQNFIHALLVPAVDKPLIGHVDLHANAGLADIYFYRGGCFDAQNWNLALLFADSVVKAYLLLPVDEQRFTRVPAMKAYTTLGLVNYLRVAILRNEKPINQPTLDKLLATTAYNLIQVINLAIQTDNQVSRNHGKFVLSRLLDTYCLQGKREDARATLERYVNILPDRNKAKTEILQNMKGGCINET